MAIGVAQAVSVCLAMLNPCTAKKKVEKSSLVKPLGFSLWESF
jgi:hypothetical protein